MPKHYYIHLLLQWPIRPLRQIKPHHPENGQWSYW